ncbi:hypothetical protein AU255_10515 [Methyloprofundus sedimenti]|uniref:Cytochrome c domain-containing protein n=1 Tax=Methyloprofundus sedimenti TaxID=1420851 RepID=A0A1V8M9K4_9GAMM|nr:hypothetical protein [Methyloprofundus sedimenti]OQK18239.1 hypothetical protein AU255_10515 [Methyloprofundus sedimenti]
MKSTKPHGKQQWLINLSCLYLLFMFTNSYAVMNAFDKPVNHPPIPLLDEQGNHVLESNNPYSPKKSCAGSGCHDYEALTHAFHFQQGRDEASDTYGATRGLPHLVSPGYYGGYNCMGGDTPTVLAKKTNSNPLDFADYGSAHQVKNCMSCHVGGGWAERDRDGIRYDEKKIEDIALNDGDYYEREVDSVTGEQTLVLWDWKKSGVGEADCMFCHVDISNLKIPEDSGLTTLIPSPRTARSQFASKGFFRQAASGLMELVVDKDGKNLVTVARSMQGGEHAAHGGGAATMQPTLDEKGMPIFNWHADAFDENGRTTIPMLRFPANENCMDCHLTSNSRRGFYGFGDAAAATLTEAGQDAADGTLVDDYQDDVHKGKSYTDDNGQTRDIENCNSCHAKQYFKSPLANVDLDANHDFPKGNSDNDVRNDLDYAPNAKSCEACHINSKNAVVPSGHDTLLDAHRELWKASGDMAGYSKESLTKITKTHFDVVSCQACHINNKKSRGTPIQLMYRYRIAANGKSTMVPYNPRVRSYWQDKVSKRILAKYELLVVKEILEDAEGNPYGNIKNVITGESLGTLPVKLVAGHGGGAPSPTVLPPETYEQYVALKKAYDALLTQKGYKNPDTAEVLSESNEYIISHNTRPSPDSVQCEECHERKQSGAFSALISPKGILGEANSQVIRTIPDPRLVEEGLYKLDLSYMKLQANGDITENVSDVLFETKIDPFMSRLKNSSASEIIGEFKKFNTDSLLHALGPELGGLMAPDLPSTDTFVFQVNKGNFNLRNMAAAIDGNTVNNILFPTYRGALGLINGAEDAAQGILDARSYGKLRSNVYFFDIRDSSKKHVDSYNGVPMFIKVAYKGTKTNLSDINVIMANWALNSVYKALESDLLMIVPASDDEEGYVIFKTTEPGYFVIADK